MADIRLKLREAMQQYRRDFEGGKRPTQAQIAVGAGIDPATLSRYLNNRVERTDLAVVAKLCKYLGIQDMNDIFEYVEDET